MAYLDFIPTNGTANAEGVLQSRASSFGAWATERSGGSTPVLLPTQTEETQYQVGSTPGVNLFYIQRGFFKIAYSGIPVGATITGATWNVNMRRALPTDEIRTRCVLALGTQSNTLVAGDWGAFSTEYGRDAATSWADGWLSFSLNAAGLSAILNGATVKYCYTTVNDFDNVQPPDNGFCGVIWKSASYTVDTALRPYIRVTYTTSAIKTFNGLAKASVKTVNGLAIASVKTFNGLA